jgi:hypothetical protein
LRNRLLWCVFTGLLRCNGRPFIVGCSLVGTYLRFLATAQSVTILTGDIRTLYILLRHRAVILWTSECLIIYSPLFCFGMPRHRRLCHCQEGSPCDHFRSLGRTYTDSLWQVWPCRLCCFRVFGALVCSRFVRLAVQMRSVPDGATSRVESETFWGFRESEILLQNPNIRCTLSTVYIVYYKYFFLLG